MGLYYVCHRNGKGHCRSSWYLDSERATLEEARDAADKLRAEVPEHDGWYRDVVVLDDHPGNDEAEVVYEA